MRDNSAAGAASNTRWRWRAAWIRKLLAIGAVAVGLLFAMILIVPTFVDLGRFKSTYLPFLEQTLRRRIDVGEVRLTLVPTPSIKLSNLKISNTPALPADDFFAAEEVQLHLKLWPLLRGRFEVTEFVLERPVFNLQKQVDGAAHRPPAGKKIPAIEREARKVQPATKQQDNTVIPLVVPARLRVKDGQLNISTGGRTPVSINGIGLWMEDFSSEKSFPYRASFSYPGLKTVSLEGHLDYREEQASITLKDNRLTIQNLTLPVTGTITHLDSAPRLDLLLTDNHVDARPLMQILAVFGLAPRDVEISGPMALRIALTGPTSSLLTLIDGHFKDVKMQSKRAIKGSLNGTVSLRLPVSGSDVTRQLRGDGKLSARDGELTHVDLIKKIQRLTGVIGFSPSERREVTTFKTLDTDFTLGNGLVDFKRIYLVNRQLEINGKGTLTLNQPALDIGMDATLSRQASTKASRGKTTEFFKNQRGQLVVPLKVTGRLENPAVNIDGEKMTERGATKSMERTLGSFFKQLFRR